LRPFVGADAGKRIVHAHDRAIMERAGQLIGPGPVVGEQRVVDVLAQRLDFGPHQIAADPGPDRLERSPRDAADPPVVGRSVDQERLERLEEQARRIADARRLLRLGPDRAPQLLQHQLATGHVVAAQLGALELRDQHGAGFQLKTPEIFPQPFDGLPVARPQNMLLLGDNVNVLVVGRLGSRYAKSHDSKVITALRPSRGERPG